MDEMILCDRKPGWWYEGRCRDSVRQEGTWWVMATTRPPLDAVERAKIDIAPEAVAPQAAKLRDRAFAAIIDIVLDLGAAWVLAMAIFALVAATSPSVHGGGSSSQPGLARVWLWVLLPVCYVLLAVTQEVWVLQRHGTTVGRSRVGLRVVSTTDAPLTVGRLLLRLLLGAKGPIGPITVLYQIAGGEGFQDTVARTRVVKAPREGAVITGRLAYLPGILAALAGVMVVLGLLLLTRFESLFIDLGAGAALIPRIATEVRRWAALWAPAGALALGLVWLRPRNRFDAVAAWWMSIILISLAVIGLLVLGLAGLLSILSLYTGLSG
jgi:hypothetical protein